MEMRNAKKGQGSNYRELIDSSCTSEEEHEGYQTRVTITLNIMGIHTATHRNGVCFLLDSLASALRPMSAICTIASSRERTNN